MTKDEILLVMIILLAFVVGAAAEYYRHSGSKTSSERVIGHQAAVSGSAQ
jgi:hypothetical protein